MDAKRFQDVCNQDLNLPNWRLTRHLIINLIDLNLVDANLVVNFESWYQQLIVHIIFVKLEDLNIAIQCQGDVSLSIEIFKALDIHDGSILESLNLGL